MRKYLREYLKIEKRSLENRLFIEDVLNAGIFRNHIDNLKAQMRRQLDKAVNAYFVEDTMGSDEYYSLLNTYYDINEQIHSMYIDTYIRLLYATNTYPLENVLV